jgi:hypothetical protein
VFPWGTVASPDAPGKELYLVPLLPEAPLPEYLMMLDYLSFPAVRAMAVLIGFFILHKIKKPTRPSNFSILTNPAPMYPSPNPPNPPNPLLSGSLDFDLSALTPEFIADLLKNNPSIGTTAAAAFSPVSQPSFYHDAPYVSPAPYNPPYPTPPNMTPAPSHSQYPPVVPLASNTPRYIDRSPEFVSRFLTSDVVSLGFLVGMTAGAAILTKVLEPEGGGVGARVGMVVTTQVFARLLHLLLLTTVGLRAVEVEVGDRDVVRFDKVIIIS